MDENAESRFRLAALMAVAFGLLTSCVDEEGVLLSAELASPVLTVSSSALVTEVTGGFELHLSLGERASDPTTVELGTFALKRDGEVLLNPLELATNPEFPVTVAVGGEKHVVVTVGPHEAEADAGELLCSGELEIVGTLTDSLGDDRPMTVSSGSFPPACD